MPPTIPEPCDVLSICPLCGGEMEAEYHSRDQYTCKCKDCKTTLSVPKDAWAVWRTKRESTGH